MACCRTNRDAAVKLTVQVDERVARLDVVRQGGGCRFRFDGGAEQDATLEEVEPGVYSILLNGRSYEAKIEPGADRLFVAVGGRRFAVQVRDPRAWDPGLKSRCSEGRESISTPMPGKVVRVLVSEGDSVQAGQGIIVVEAMKMQNEMKAPKAGRVVSVDVRPGDTVAAGQVLASVE